MAANLALSRGPRCALLAVPAAGGTLACMSAFDAFCARLSCARRYGQPELTDICVQNAGMASLQFHVVTVMKREKPLLGRGNVSGATTSGPLSVISATGAMTFTKTKQQLPISQASSCLRAVSPTMRPARLPQHSASCRGAWTPCAAAAVVG